MQITPKRYTFADRWGEAWATSVFKIHTAATFLVLFWMALRINHFFTYVQSSPGHQLADPLLSVVPAYDVSTLIFGIIYSSIATGLIYLAQDPWMLLRTAEAYCLLTLMRICTLYLLPLEPPLSMILLHDPIIDVLFYRDMPITKDLFFSGHVSTAFLFVLAISNSYLKYLFVTLTFIIGCLLLVQHVHYTIDIVAAPAFAWIAYQVVGRLHSRFHMRAKKEPG